MSTASLVAPPELAPPRARSTLAATWTGALTLAVPAMAALAARVATGPRPIDDAYITFRYARNLAEGLGLVYNPGEWVLGTTAPFWALVLSAGYRLGLTDLPQLATVIAALCDAASALLLARLALAMGLRPSAAALVGLAWALNPMSIAFASGGMETSTFVLVLLGVLTLATHTSRQPLAAGIAGAATLLRPEGALLAVAVTLWSALGTRAWRHCAVVAAGALAPMLVAGLLLFGFYGSPLPHSVSAKQVAYAPVGPVDNAAVLLLHAGLPGDSTFLLAVLPISAWLTLGLLGLASLVWLTRAGAISLAARGVACQPFAIFAVLFLSFYVLVGLRGVRLFNWYAVPIQPLYVLAAAAGLTAIRPSRAGWVAGLLVLWQLAAIDWRMPFSPAGENLVREHLFLDAGQALRASLPPTATVAAPEIGALGYASNLRVLDTVGLVSPVALQYYPLPADRLVTDNAVPTALIEHQRPDAIVALDAYVKRTLLTDAAFVRDYRLERRVPAKVWQSEELLVYRRVAPE